MKGKFIGHYLVSDLIGQGTYGRVYKGLDRLTGQFVAIKIVSNQKLTTQKLIDSLDQEITILKETKHQNIVNLLDVIKTNEETFLVMEFCEGGDFSHFMKKKKRLSEQEAKFFLQQMASALDCMHKRNLIHRDLKPSNILLTSKDDDRSVIKIADFGYARYVNAQTLAETACGTPLYMAPEVFTSQPYDGKADLWSIGCILFEMIFGVVPYTAKTQVLLFEKIKSSAVDFPKTVPISDSCKDLLKKLLERDPLRRMGFEEFFNHPFVDYHRVPEPESPIPEEIYDFDEEDDSLHKVVQEAMNSLLPNGKASPEEKSTSNSGNVLGSGSLTRPKTKPYKELTNVNQEEEFVIVNRDALEVNVIADVLDKAFLAPARGSPPSYFQRGLSDSPPLGIQSGSPQFPAPSPSSSPSVGSALSRALASTAAKFIWTTASSTTPEEQNARDILSSLASLSQSASSDDEKAIWKSITASARRAYAVVDLAKLKQAASNSEENTYFACVLYLKALSIIRVGMFQAKKIWQMKDQTISPQINQVVQFLRGKFNEYLEQADIYIAKLKNTKFDELLSSKKYHIDQAKLLFDRARELGKEAGIEEVVGNNAISERYYTKALLLFETLIAKDLPEAETLSDSDRKTVENYASSTLRRLQRLQKKLPSLSEPNSPPTY